jgi:hypothetical protein
MAGRSHRGSGSGHPLVALPRPVLALFDGALGGLAGQLLEATRCLVVGGSRGPRPARTLHVPRQSGWAASRPFGHGNCRTR